MAVTKYPVSSRKNKTDFLSLINIQRHTMSTDIESIKPHAKGWQNCTYKVVHWVAEFELRSDLSMLDHHRENRSAHWQARSKLSPESGHTFGVFHGDRKSVV